MTLNLQSLFAAEYQYVLNTEPVTLFRKLADGSYDGGTPVGNALRLEQKRTLAPAGNGLLAKDELPWLVWSAQTVGPPPSSANPPIKRDDMLVDSSGAKWLVKECDIQAWGVRFFLQTVQTR